MTQQTSNEPRGNRRKPTTSPRADERNMRRALSLALRGFRSVEPNPMVGAVVVRGGRVVAEGYHERFGGPHAEINAIRAAGPRSKDATLYVTLEPCTHFGKTPPCVDAVINARFKRVVVAMRDPNPIVKGNGIRRLRRAGIEVVEGILRHHAECLNKPFTKFIKTGMPFVIAKWAMTLDGRTATHTGDSKWITSDEARAIAHQLRACADAVVAGIGTVIKDDPLLTCRVKSAAPFAPWVPLKTSIPELPASDLTATSRNYLTPLQKPQGAHYKIGSHCGMGILPMTHGQGCPCHLPRTPARIIIDAHARIPLTSRIATTARRHRTIIAVTQHSTKSRRSALARAGCELLVLPSDGNGVNLGSLLEALGKMGMLTVLVEGGSTLLGSFFDQKLIDYVIAFISPKLVGGVQSPPPIGGKGTARIGDAIHLAEPRIFHTRSDIIMTGYCQP